MEPRFFLAYHLGGRGPRQTFLDAINTYPVELEWAEKCVPVERKMTWDGECGPVYCAKSRVSWHGDLVGDRCSYRGIIQETG